MKSKPTEYVQPGTVVMFCESETEAGSPLREPLGPSQSLSSSVHCEPLDAVTPRRPFFWSSAFATSGGMVSLNGTTLASQLTIQPRPAVPDGKISQPASVLTDGFSKLALARRFAP